MDQRRYLRSIVESNRIALGVQVSSSARPVIELCGDLGLDFVWLDLEHKGPSPYDSEAMEHYARTAEASAIDLVVRLPSGSSPLVRKVLDSGINNIVVPQVTTADDVRQAVKASRFRYDCDPGSRGSSISRANRWGGAVDGYHEHEDTTVFIGVMIENIQAMENLDEILDVPGLGFVRMGSGDMAISLGNPIERNAPAITNQREELVRSCGEYDIPLSGTVHELSEVKTLVDNGYRILTLGKDLGILRSVIRDRMDSIRDRIGDESR